MNSEVIRNIAFWKFMQEDKESLVNVFLESMTEDQQVEFVGPVVKLSKSGIEKVLPILQEIDETSCKINGDSVLIEAGSKKIVEEAAKCGLILNEVDGRYEVLVVAEQEMPPEIEPKGLKDLPGAERRETEAKKPDETAKILEKMKTDKVFRDEMVKIMMDSDQLKKIPEEMKKEVLGAISQAMEGIPKSLTGAFEKMMK